MSLTSKRGGICHTLIFMTVAEFGLITVLLVAGNNHVRNPSVSSGLSQIDNKTLQWFGATISSSLKDGGPILVSKPTNNFNINV